MGSHRSMAVLTILAFLLLSSTSSVQAASSSKVFDYTDCRRIEEQITIVPFMTYLYETPNLGLNYQLSWTWVAGGSDAPETNFTLKDPNGTKLFEPGYVDLYKGELLVKVPGKYKFIWYNKNQGVDITIFLFIDVCHAVSSLFPFPDWYLWSGLLVTVIVIVPMIFFWRLRKKATKRNRNGN